MEKKTIYRDVNTGEILTEADIRKLMNSDDSKWYLWYSRMVYEWEECPWQIKAIFAGCFLMIILTAMI